MELKDKVIAALVAALEPEYVRVEADHDDGETTLSGFVVTRLFEGVSSYERQVQIDAILKAAPLSREEFRQVLMIAGLTPAEYDYVGSRIRVEAVKELEGGGVEVRLYGGPDDAKYVRKALTNQEGVEASEPVRVADAPGVLMSFRAARGAQNRLTKREAIGLLAGDRYIEVLPTA